MRLRARESEDATTKDTPEIHFCLTPYVPLAVPNQNRIPVLCDVRKKTRALP